MITLINIISTIIIVSSIAHLELDINHQKQSALSILRAGLIPNLNNEFYIKEYASFLLEHGEYDNARLLLESSIRRIGEENCSELWEMLLMARREYEMRITTLKELRKVSNVNLDVDCCKYSSLIRILFIYLLNTIYYLSPLFMMTMI